MSSRDGAGHGGDGPTAELEVLRGDLAQILYDHTRDRVPYRFGDHVTALHDDGDRVRVGFAHGAEEEFDLVAAGEGRTVTLRPDRHGTTRAVLSFLSLSPAPGRMTADAQQELVRAEFAGAGWQAERVLDGMGRAPLSADAGQAGALLTETPQPLRDPSGAIVYPGFDADLLYWFRLYSVLAQALLWGVIGVAFAPLAERMLDRPGVDDAQPAAVV